MAARSKVWTIFGRWNTGFMGSNTNLGMGVYVRLFCVCVVLNVGWDLAKSWFPIQGVVPSVYRIEKLKKVVKVQQKAVEP
jgi:hypothetical protein